MYKNKIKGYNIIEIKIYLYNIGGEQNGYKKTSKIWLGDEIYTKK